MELRKALRLGSHPCLALVGAGGKTSALFRLAEEYSPPVVLTASTHLSIDQTEDFVTNHAGLYHRVKSLAEVKALDRELSQGVRLLTGPVEGDRVKGLSRESLSWLGDSCRGRKIPLFIEADGSRMRPLKAPADHEPAIPPFVEQVLVIAGLSALGKPLNFTWVHRPEIFAELSGCNPGELITFEALTKVLSHPAGGMKNIPSGARRVVLLNQVDTYSWIGTAEEMVKPLLEFYNAVVISSLQPGENRIDPFRGGELQGSGPSTPVHSVHEPVAGIILAGGESQRYGKPKQLLTWKGKPFVWQSAKSALNAGLAPVLVVTGAYPEAVERAVGDLPVQIVFNPSWQQGQGTSVSAGVKALPKSSGAAVFFLADQPQIPSILVNHLVEAHAKTLAPIVAPWIEHRRANPVLFDRDLFVELGSLEGEVGGRQFFSRYALLKVPWDDPAILLDVDTPEDFARLKDLTQ